MHPLQQSQMFDSKLDWGSHLQPDKAEAINEEEEEEGLITNVKWQILILPWSWLLCQIFSSEGQHKDQPFPSSLLLASFLQQLH